MAILAVLGAFAVLATHEGRPFSFFSKEPAETLEVSRYIGWQAHITVLITMFGVGSVLFAALAVRMLGGGREPRRFLLAVGLFTGLLVLDDFLQFHESLYPRLLGIEDYVVYPIYAAMLALIVWTWGRRAVADNIGLVAAAGVFLSTSVLADVFLDAHTFPNYHYIEDGSKMLGFTLWTAFLVRAGLQSVVTAAPPSSSPAPSRHAAVAGGPERS
ncbi:MAG: hypothetical protein AB7J32_07550 [Pseudonocardia sp.]